MRNPVVSCSFAHVAGVRRHRRDANLDRRDLLSQMGRFSTGRLPHLNFEKKAGCTAHSRDLSRVANNFCQNTRKNHFGISK